MQISSFFLTLARILTNFVIVKGFMVHILVDFGDLWLTIRLLQWGKFFWSCDAFCTTALSQTYQIKS